MDYSDILQDISVDLSYMVKKHLKNIKKLNSKQQRQFGKLFSDMKDGIDDLSEGVTESVNEGNYDTKTGLYYVQSETGVNVPFTKERIIELTNYVKKLSKMKSSNKQFTFTPSLYVTDNASGKSILINSSILKELQSALKKHKLASDKDF
jgi:hypothetical protein